MGKREIQIESSWQKIALFLIIITIMQITPHAFAKSRCKPLLVMIQGGGVIKSDSEGSGMRNLVRNIKKEYERKGIKVMQLKNNTFFSSISKFVPGPYIKIKTPEVREAAKRIDEAGYWPLVIVGHSLGGFTAFEIARRLRSSLLVTLDVVAWKEERPKPAMTAKWINVYAPGNAAGNGVGNDWDYEAHADQNIRIEVSHYNPKGMYKSVEARILNTLQKYGGSCGDLKPKVLCTVPGATCSAR